MWFRIFVMMIVLKQRTRSDEFRILSNEYELLTQVKNTHPTYSKKYITSTNRYVDVQFWLFFVLF